MKHNATVIGLDIAKNVFYAVGRDERGHEVLKRKMTRDQVLTFFANLPAAKVGIEACASAHYWAREISKLGHEVRLIAGQRVSRRVVGSKNDYRDAKAICELRAEPETLYVPKGTSADQYRGATGCTDAAPGSSAPGGKPHSTAVADPQPAGRIRLEFSPRGDDLAQGIARRARRRT